MGAAATTGNDTESLSLPKFSCEFTVEKNAIYLALSTISVT